MPHATACRSQAASIQRLCYAAEGGNARRSDCFDNWQDVRCKSACFLGLCRSPERRRLTGIASSIAQLRALRLALCQCGPCAFRNQPPFLLRQRCVEVQHVQHNKGKSPARWPASMLVQIGKRQYAQNATIIASNRKAAGKLQKSTLMFIFRRSPCRASVWLRSVSMEPRFPSKFQRKPAHAVPDAMLRLTFSTDERLRASTSKEPETHHCGDQGRNGSDCDHDAQRGPVTGQSCHWSAFSIHR